jgi:hypothetical protein
VTQGAGIFKMLITVNNLEKTDNVLISMPDKIYSKDGKPSKNNYV